MTSFFKKGPFSRSSDRENDVNFQNGPFFTNGVLRRKERLSLQIVRIIREKVCRVLFGSARTRQQKLYYFNRTVIIKNNYVFIERVIREKVTQIMCLLKEVVF